ncbi:uncharacterized protein LOC118416749 [Branchiostoma floridae]|uniref:Uncharacterized protein LOC118416749 n=1 Tax=Branchiostoma floridae TaxID=7739 RepID=A0A9J7L806_BRAFL|nr:uncharacterized protein LOC118416749 [Branchiostoma floridae]
MSCSKSLKATDLHSSWRVDFDWKDFPEEFVQGCCAVASVLCVLTVAVLYSLITVAAFAVSHAQVSPPDTKWRENVLLWTAICLPTAGINDDSEAEEDMNKSIEANDVIGGEKRKLCAASTLLSPLCDADDDNDFALTTNKRRSI